MTEPQLTMRYLFFIHDLVEHRNKIPINNSSLTINIMASGCIYYDTKKKTKTKQIYLVLVEALAVQSAEAAD